MSKPSLRTIACAATILGFPITGAVAQQDKADDHLLPCVDTKEFCKSSQQQFIKWFPRAWKGDYQGQRNVAFFLGRDSDGAVKPNPTLACAWRIVIIASGSPKIDNTDTANLRIDCNKLDPLEKEVATRQAQNIQRNIRRR